MKKKIVTDAHIADTSQNCLWQDDEATMKPQISYVHCHQVLTTIIVVDQKVLALPGVWTVDLWARPGAVSNVWSAQLYTLLMSARISSVEWTRN